LPAHKEHIVTEYLKVAGHDGLVRDVSNRAIVNTNTADYQRYINQRTAQASRQAQIDRHETDIIEIKSDLTEIKHMLLALLNK
jgi:hypothetical protein